MYTRGKLPSGLVSVYLAIFVLPSNAGGNERASSDATASGSAVPGDDHDVRACDQGRVPPQVRLALPHRRAYSLSFYYRMKSKSDTETERDREREKRER